jgi:hypothetical protein
MDAKAIHERLQAQLGAGVGDANMERRIRRS